MMLYLLTPPAAEPVTLAAVKAALRIDDARFDALLPGLIASARAVAEQETGRQLVEQTWRAEIDDWPASDEPIAIYRATAAAVSYWAGSTWQTLASGYVFAPSGNGTALAPALGSAWPALGEVALGPRVRIDLTCGVPTASAASVPACIQTFITALVGQLLQSPELTAAEAVHANPLLARLLDSVRLWA